MPQAPPRRRLAALPPRQRAVAACHQCQGHHLSQVCIILLASVIHPKLADPFLSRSQPEGSRNQAAALRAEGVEVAVSAMGELSVDFSEYGWFPDELPSEADGQVVDEDDED